MIALTNIADFVVPVDFLTSSLAATGADEVEDLLKKLPIVSGEDYTHDASGTGWQEGKFHWVPVGRDYGNSGRIQLAANPINPIAERLINGMEAFIEMERHRELLANHGASAPASPREAVMRYFGLPSLDNIPKIDDKNEQKELWDRARALARGLQVGLNWNSSARQFSVVVQDQGIGQTPDRVHSTLLSLGATTKGDKQYLIGVFGQGGSSAFFASKYSIVMSRRAPDLIDGGLDGVGWTVVRHIMRKNRRDHYYAYLAAHPDGRVPSFGSDSADQANFQHGSRFAHIGYDFQKGGSAIARNLYAALNHVLYNPVLPYELYASRETADVMWGNSYRLSNLVNRGLKPPIDKSFPLIPVTLK